ncbi:MAG: hypothetical protein HQ515_03510 [Phycisphaeraceae bacterium]|nr:hypothetical protein [Phycisphaeraceae bacterium]
MIDKLNNNQISGEALNANRGALGATQTVNHSVSPQASIQGPDNTQDASLQVSFDSLIEQAKQVPADDGSAVARAKALIASGQLDTPENIQKAAQNILKYGV